MTDTPKVLVACPTYSGMEYCLKEWADAYKAFAYEPRGALQVDNSDANLHYLHLIRAQGIPAVYQERRFKFIWDTLELGWRRIVEYAHDHGYDLICSIEADVICPPETLDVLVDEWLAKGPKAVVAHRYHPRGVDRPPVPEGMVIDERHWNEVKRETWFDTLGCTLFPTELMYETRDEWLAIYEVELYRQAQVQGYERVRLKDRLDIEHLEDPKRWEVRRQKPNSDRLNPAVLSVKRQENDVFGGRRGEDLAPGGELKTATPMPAHKAGRSDQEKEVQRLRLMANQLMAEVHRLRGDSWRERDEAHPCNEVTVHCADKDTARYFELHGFRVEDEGERIAATITAPCVHHGEAGCAEYDDRPAHCVGHGLGAAS